MAYTPYQKPVNESKIISWLSIFSSLCSMRREEDDTLELSEHAHALVEKLYNKYPAAVDDTFEANQTIQVEVDKKSKNSEPFGSGDKVTMGVVEKKPWAR